MELIASTDLPGGVMMYWRMKITTGKESRWPRNEALAPESQGTQALLQVDEISEICTELESCAPTAH